MLKSKFLKYPFYLLTTFLLIFNSSFGECYIYKHTGENVSIERCPENISANYLNNSNNIFIISTRTIPNFHKVNTLKVCNYYIFFEPENIHQIYFYSLDNCDKNRNLSVNFFVNNRNNFICDVYRRNLEKERCNSNDTFHFGEVLITTGEISFSRCNNCEVNLYERYGFYLYFIKKKRECNILCRILASLKNTFRRFFGNDEVSSVIAFRGINEDFNPTVSLVFKNDIISFSVLSNDKKVIVKYLGNKSVELNGNTKIEKVCEMLISKYYKGSELIYIKDISKDEHKKGKSKINLSEIG